MKLLSLRVDIFKMQLIKKKLILSICLSSVLQMFGQQNLDGIQTAFQEYSNRTLTEKLFTHTDKDFYLAGEIIWFKIYVVNGDDNKPIDLSKVAYVEVLDKDHRSVLQGKIALEKGTGSGSLYIPVSFNSGVYRLRAYTNWMKNFDPGYYFEKPVTIVNSLKNPNTPATARRNYDLQFFPEGGNLVQGIQSKVAFKIVDQSGKGIDCKGFVVNKNNDTVVTFQPFKFGIGNFLLTPEAGNDYRAIIKLADTTFTRELPAPLDQGYVLKLSSTSGSQLHISVTTNIKTADAVYLFVHTRQISKINERGVVANGTVEFNIDKNKLAEGIAHMTIFDRNSLPVCERLYFLQPSQKLIIQPTMELAEFASRKKVSLAVNSVDESEKSVPADISVSVYRVDSFESIQSEQIDNYFWLTSDLKGIIESPSYYFSERNAEVDEATDNLMLTHGWRRFTWQNVLKSAKPGYSFVPEYKGHIIYAKVTNTKTGVPAADVLAYLSVPGSRVQLYNSRSDSTGIVRFYTKEFFGPNEIVLQTDATDSIYKIELVDPFSNKNSPVGLPAFELPESLKGIISDYNLSMQIQNSFVGDKLKRFNAPVIDSNAFFGPPDIQYLLDNYTRYSTMEEVLREYVYEVLVRRQKENFHLIVSDVDNNIFLDDPLTLINGIPVFDPNRVIKYDPLKIRKIDIVKRKYFYGPSIFNGIINFVTYQSDPSILSDLKPVVLEYEGLQYQREFYSPVYETQEQISSRLPDFRNVLYWSPAIHTDEQGKAQINFFTSDLKGKYIAVFQGMNVDGRFGGRSVSFEVK
jgi:hypothetical protein